MTAKQKRNNKQSDDALCARYVAAYAAAHGNPCPLAIIKDGDRFYTAEQESIGFMKRDVVALGRKPMQAICERLEARAAAALPQPAPAPADDSVPLCGIPSHAAMGEEVARLRAALLRIANNASARKWNGSNGADLSAFCEIEKEARQALGTEVGSARERKDNQ